MNIKKYQFKSRIQSYEIAHWVKAPALCQSTWDPIPWTHMVEVRSDSHKLSYDLYMHVIMAFMHTQRHTQTHRHMCMHTHWICVIKIIVRINKFIFNFLQRLIQFECFVWGLQCLILWLTIHFWRWNLYCSTNFRTLNE